MSAPDNVLVQSNFKSPLGALHNAYGHDEPSYDLALSILEDRVARLAALEQQIAATANVAKTMPVAPPAQQPPSVPAPAAPAAAPADWGTPPPPAPSFAQAMQPSCSHGPRTARSGSGAKGPWRAWFCPQPKGAPQCEAIWVRRGSPEWDGFPA